MITHSRLEWSDRSVGFQSPRWLTEYLRQGCVDDKRICLGFCPHFAIMFFYFTITNMVYVNTTFYQFNTSKTVDATPTFLSPHVTGSVGSQGGHFGRKPREERGFTAGATGLVDCRLPRELVNRVWGNISSYRWCNHCEQTCRNMFEDSLRLNGMQIYIAWLEVVQLLLYSKAIPHLCKYTV